MSNQQKAMGEFVVAVDRKIRSELKLRCEAFKINVKCPEEFSVLTALIARQATLAAELTSAPQLWNGHSAPLFLRAMTDVHITTAWILYEKRCERAKQYIQHGLGQAILAIEHKKNEMEGADPEKVIALQELVDHEIAWINMQKLSFLVEVNVGSWSGKTTREMAKEAGIPDFYNHVYTPFSQCAHSTWYHLGRYNSAPSSSPLTRPVWEPGINGHPIDVGHVHLAAKYLDKTFNEFDLKALGKTPGSSLQDWILEQLEVYFPEEKIDPSKA